MGSTPDGPPVSDADAYRVFETLRWRDGPHECPHCGSVGGCRFLSPADGISRRTRTGARSARRVWRCGGCRRQFSVLTGTVFEGTRVPLPGWLDAVAILSARPRSAWTRATAEVSRVAGVSPETARAMIGLMLSATLAAGSSSGDQPQG